jgi:hypothetical protein
VTYAYVTVPIAGSVTVTLTDVDPDTADEELLNQARDLIWRTDSGLQVRDTPDVQLNEIEDYDYLVQGNVVFAPVHHYHIEFEESE